MPNWPKIDWGGDIFGKFIQIKLLKRTKSACCQQIPTSQMACLTEPYVRGFVRPVNVRLFVCFRLCTEPASCVFLVCGLSVPAQWLVSSSNQFVNSAEREVCRVSMLLLLLLLAACRDGCANCGSRRVKLIYKHATAEGYAAWFGSGPGHGCGPGGTPWESVSNMFNRRTTATTMRMTTTTTTKTATMATITNKMRTGWAMQRLLWLLLRRLLLLLWQSK